MSTPVRINSATLLMGPTGSGKSSLIATLAEYVWETYRKTLWLYSCDGGGFPARVQALIKPGIIRVWRMRTRGEAFETCIQASKGWWPSVIRPETGETVPNVKLVPPLQIRYTMLCPNGHVVKAARYQSQLTPMTCPTCKLLVTAQTMRVEKDVHVTHGFEERGAVAIDGLTSACSWMMLDMANKRGLGLLKGEEGALGGVIESGDLKLGSNNRSHYGFAQTRAEEMVLNALAIPNLVVPPTFTALLLETVDEGGLPVKGPKIAGKAKTDEVGSWVGNCLETMKVKSANAGEGDVFRLNLEEYIDDAGTRHLIKHRGAPGTMPKYLQDPADPALAFTQFNLGLFFKMLEEGLQRTEQTIGQTYQDTPGLPEGEMTFGSEEPAAPAAAPAGTTPSAPAPTPVAAAPRPVAAPAPLPAVAAPTRRREDLPPPAPAAVMAAAAPSTTAVSAAPAARPMQAAPELATSTASPLPTPRRPASAPRPMAPPPGVAPRK